MRATAGPGQCGPRAHRTHTPHNHPFSADMDVDEHKEHSPAAALTPREELQKRLESELGAVWRVESLRNAITSCLTKAGINFTAYATLVPCALDAYLGGLVGDASVVDTSVVDTMTVGDLLCWVIARTSNNPHTPVDAAMLLLMQKLIVEMQMPFSANLLAKACLQGRHIVAPTAVALSLSTAAHQEMWTQAIRDELVSLHKIYAQVPESATVSGFFITDLFESLFTMSSLSDLWEYVKPTLPKIRGINTKWENHRCSTLLKYIAHTIGDLVGLDMGQVATQVRINLASTSASDHDSDRDSDSDLDNDSARRLACEVTRVLTRSFHTSRVH